MNKSNKSTNVPKSIFVWPVAVLLMAAASLPLKAEKPDNPGEGEAPLQLLFGTGGAKKSESPVPVEQAAAAGERFLHYRPAGMRFGDPMPIFRDGVYHVFYLKAKSSPPEELIWAHVSSRDLLHWKEHPDLPMRGCTGCFIVKDGVAYAFTGNSRADRWVSRDPEMEIWERDPAGVSVQLDPRWYHREAWRDPSVVWVPEEKQYWMVACARTAAGAGRQFKNGCVALATSSDLENWQIEPPLWSPDAFTWPEDVELFQLGDRWALVYNHEGHQLRLADSPRGPWVRPARETLNKGLLYGRTLFDGRRRLMFGILQDNGYGGDMLVPRELYLHADGSAAARCAEEVVTACRAAPDATGGKGAEVFRPLSGTWQATPASIKAEMPAGQSAMAIWPDAPENFYLEAKLRIAPGARAFIVLRGKADTLEEAPVAVLADPTAETVAFTKWWVWNSAIPLGLKIGEGDIWPLIAPHKFREEAEIDVQMILRGELLEVFFDERHSMSTRVARGKGALGLFAREGSVEWENLVVRQLD